MVCAFLSSPSAAVDSTMEAIGKASIIASRIVKP